MEQPIIRAVTHETSEAKVTVVGVRDSPGVSASLFRHLADVGANVDMIVQNTSTENCTDISFTVPTEDLPKVVGVLDGELLASLEGKSVRTDETIGRVSLIGAGMKSNPGVAAKMFEVLAANDINIIMISTSAIRVSCVVDVERVEDAVLVLHTAFGLDAA